MTTPHILYTHLRAPDRTLPAESDFDHVLDLAHDLTPVVEALPPDALLLDIRGALRYFDRGPVDLAARLRVRSLALHGVDLTIGVAGNPLLARMAAQAGEQGAVRAVTDDQVRAFLAPLPMLALPGVGPATAKTLAGYGLEYIGQLAAAPLPTVQRILGAVAGRRLHERAHGIDRTPVTPTNAVRSLSGERAFGRDETDPAHHRRALLAIAQDLGLQLRTQRQATGSLTLTVLYTDRSTTVRTRKLPEATAHTADLVDAAYRLYTSLALQRARVRALSLRADGIRPSEEVSHQLTFDPADDLTRRVEAVADRARTRFGANSIGPATLYGAA